MEKKYKLSDVTKEVDGVTVRRIIALKSFGFVSEGDFGGWIESEENLSQDGDAWVSENGCVMGRAVVTGHAQVCGSALVDGEAYIGDLAFIGDRARVTDRATVTGLAMVCGEARVEGDAQVTGVIRVAENAVIGGHDKIAGRFNI